MTKQTENAIYFNDYLGCFGDFSVKDPVCKKFCVLSLRCSIEKDQGGQIEVLEEIVTSDEIYMTMH